ncbi:basic salivary proline-rich protein 3-like [Canis lupus familiaris]|uniref:basic salivary proline-rich protein 3-like n=1 Tax=Canis lupus familiaris TaxID=9615 RepID=UPI0018F73033|nr:basic salivary proline-rich protein 3-like [Canis lupus familiaris]XP_038319551.1 basic salivary proline-rich protein 3-like [Canis lupus familiaris]
MAPGPRRPREARRGRARPGEGADPEGPGPAGRPLPPRRRGRGRGPPRLGARAQRGAREARPRPPLSDVSLRGPRPRGGVSGPGDRRRRRRGRLKGKDPRKCPLLSAGEADAGGGVPRLAGVVGAARVTSGAARPRRDGAPRVTSGAEAGAVHQHQGPRAGSGHGAAAPGQPEALPPPLCFPRARPEPPDSAGLGCRPPSEAERRRRRTETSRPGPAAPFPARRTGLGPQPAGAPGAPQPRPLRPLRPLRGLPGSGAQVASSPGRSWTTPGLAARRGVPGCLLSGGCCAPLPQPRAPF